MLVLCPLLSLMLSLLIAILSKIMVCIKVLLAKTNLLTDLHIPAAARTQPPIARIRRPCVALDGAISPSPRRGKSLSPTCARSVACPSKGHRGGARRTRRRGREERRRRGWGGRGQRGWRRWRGGGRRARRGAHIVLGPDEDSGSGDDAGAADVKAGTRVCGAVLGPCSSRRTWAGCRCWCAGPGGRGAGRARARRY